MSSIFLPLIRNGPTDPTLPVEPPLPPVEPTGAAEVALIDLLISSLHQQRIVLNRNEILMRVAEDRADDMAERNYFDHVNPDGVAANYLVRKAGYKLPDFYGKGPKDNNIECIGAGYPTALAVWTVLTEHSPGHRVALLGENSFYRDQNEYGVGYCHKPGSVYEHYWVVIIARQE